MKQLHKKLDDIVKADLWRTRIPYLRKNHSILSSEGGMHHLAGNDYLQLARHPHVIEAASAALLKTGLGSSASPVVAGYNPYTEKLEAAFAEHLGFESACVMNSGYHANLALMTSFAGRSSTILADRLCHASLLDGIALSKAHLVRFPHQDMEAYHRLHKKHTPLITLSETLFSMEGTITDISTLIQTPLNILDDSHGFGFFTKEHYGCMDRHSTLLMISFGKSLASFGAIILGSSAHINLLIQTARTYRYSTALPAALVAGTQAALSCIQKEPWRREKLLDLCHHFNEEAKKHDLLLATDHATPIRSIITHSSIAALQMSEQLRKAGFLVAAIRPPSVPENTSRLRISLHVHLSKQEISALIHTMKKIGL